MKLLFMVVLCYFGCESVEMTSWFQGDEPYISPGDIYVGHLSSLLGHQGVMACAGHPVGVDELQYFLASVYALERINTDGILPGNLTLGMVFLDICQSEVRAVGQAMRLIACDGVKDMSTLGDENDEAIKSMMMMNTSDICPVVNVVIGPYLSDHVMATSPVLTVHGVPQITPTGTSSELKHDNTYPLLYRMVPSGDTATKVIADLLRALTWSYIQVVHEDTSYGLNDFRAFNDLCPGSGICIEKVHHIADDFSRCDYVHLVKALRKTLKARAVVVFAAAERVRGLLEASQSSNESAGAKLSWVFSETGSSMEVYDGLDTATVAATFSVDWSIQINNGLKTFIERSHPTGLLDYRNFREGWMYLFNCSYNASTLADHIATPEVGNCSDYTLKDAAGYRYNSKAHLTAEAFFRFAEAVKMCINNSSRGPVKTAGHILPQAACLEPDTVVKYLDQATLNYSGVMVAGFKRKGVERGYRVFQMQCNRSRCKLRKVGRWSVTSGLTRFRRSSLRWNSAADHDDIRQPESRCSQPCLVGQVRVTVDACCWSCYPCQAYERVVENGTDCARCLGTTWPDEPTRTACLEIVPNYLKYCDTYGICVLVMAGLGVLMSLITLGIVVKYRENRAVKGASVELIVVILFGVLAGYTAVIPLLSSPTSMSCLFRRLLGDGSSTIIYGGLLMKITRIYVVFRASDKLEKPSVYVRLPVQLTLVGVITVTQV